MLSAPFDNIRQLLEARAEQTPNKEFLFVESDDSVFTYREFDDEVNRAAALLASLGVEKGDRVSLLLTNRAEYLLFYFACFKTGAWAGPVNALLKPQEIEFIIANSEAATVITQPDLLSQLDQARANVSTLRNVIVVEDDGRWSVIGEEATPRESGINPPDTSISRDDEAVI